MSTFAQTNDDLQSQTAPVLSVEGDVPHPINLSIAELRKLPLTKSFYGDGTNETRFESASLRDVLEMAGVKFGEKLPKEALMKYIIVEDADHNQALFSLAEINAQTPTVVLAYLQDGKLLSDAEGPLRVLSNDYAKGRGLTKLRRIIIKQAVSKEGN